LVHVRKFEVRIHDGEGASEQTLKPFRTAWRDLHSSGERVVDQVRNGRLAAVQTADERGGLAVAVRLLRGVGGIEIVTTPAASEHQLPGDLKSAADPRLRGILIQVRRIARLTADTGEEQSSRDSRETRKLGAVDQAVHRVRVGVIKTPIQAVVAFVGLNVEVKAESEIQRKPPRHRSEEHTSELQ